MDIARGLHHLHAKRIIHFDLKSANVLLTRDGTAKISDVGFANIISKTHLSFEAGYTFAWAAPEVSVKLVRKLTPLMQPSFTATQTANVFCLKPSPPKK